MEYETSKPTVMHVVPNVWRITVLTHQVPHTDFLLGLQHLLSKIIKTYKTGY